MDTVDEKVVFRDLQKRAKLLGIKTTGKGVTAEWLREQIALAEVPRAPPPASPQMENILLLLEYPTPLIAVQHLKDHVIESLRHIPDMSRLIKNPFSLLRHSKEIKKYHTKQNLEGRANLINEEFVYKFDEQEKANELSFIASLFAKLCGIRTPDLMLSVEDGNLIQFIEYLPGWRNYSEEHRSLPNFAKQLAGLLAFDLTIGNGDRFVFLFRYIDNIIFANDPDYFQMEIWEEPLINEGNFGIFNDNLWSLDARTELDLDYAQKIHTLLTPSFLLRCTELMTEHFHLTTEQQAIFATKLQKYHNRNMALFPIYERLYKWAV